MLCQLQRGNPPKSDISGNPSIPIEGGRDAAEFATLHSMIGFLRHALGGGKKSSFTESSPFLDVLFPAGKW